jgi:UDP-N-acetylmuramoyl-tripeptide--D-alanyl-D-alanine ligase
MYAEAARRAGMKPSRILEFESIEPVTEWLKGNLTQDDAVLLKGSHGLRMDRITAALEVSS